MMMQPQLDFNDKSLETFFLGSNQSILIVDISFRSVLWANPAAEKAFGCTTPGFITTSLQKFLPENEQKKLQFGQHFLAKEIRFNTNTGKNIYAETAVSSILFDEDEAWVFTLADVTERKLYRQMLEEAIDEELSLKTKNKQLKDLAYTNFHLVRKPLANILGLVNVLDGSVTSDKTLGEVLAFLKESGNEMDGLIKNLDPQQY